MNHLPIPLGRNTDLYEAASMPKSIKKLGVRWKKRLRISFLVIVMAAILAPIVLAWTGNIWIDENKLAAVQQSNSYVKLDEMPDHVWKAFVAIEDHRFMQHPGVDPVGLSRAIWVDIKEGAYVQGGSTITMQLARNLFLTNDKTMTRKVKEIAIALQLEQRYSKKELLEIYLNVIYFGHGKYGIGEAVPFYFGKKATETGNRAVTLGEAAMLASLPKGPERYSPVKNWDRAKQRQAVVLNRMNELDVIDQSESKLAKNEQIYVVPTAKRAAK
ncbi:transglycosylase domain-containing protein [Brevibacillus sp. AG]|uniref:transglycosylase domain-containing protein n=1 Tax=Brevibacillus sp. AG TaxID=3020891 RepID=UPI00232FC09A|nr:transglycosylase domain-containing protein [Brevibacillus sp. AG]MDC0759723.1 transglycosylase domain-containing protein [Brevibacillus sp. AG]